MYKIVFIKRGEEVLPIKTLCKKEDTREQIEEKANGILFDISGDEDEILDYEVVDIKDLVN